MSYPNGTIDTSLGSFTFAMTEATHVFLRGEGTVVHTVLYNVNCHLNLVDGAWITKDWHEPSLYRQGCHKEPSQAARKTVRSVLTRVWAEYLAANPGLSLLAEKAHAQEAIDQLTGEEDELVHQVQAKRAELQAAMNYLASL